MEGFYLTDPHMYPGKTSFIHISIFIGNINRTLDLNNHISHIKLSTYIPNKTELHLTTHGGEGYCVFHMFTVLIYMYPGNKKELYLTARLR